MKTSDVPQDKGMIGEYGHEVCYAVDSNGKYTLSQSLGWEPKNIVNTQAWETISEDYMLSNEYRLAESQNRIDYLDSIA